VSPYLSEDKRPPSGRPSRSPFSVRVTSNASCGYRRTSGCPRLQFPGRGA
jgi:hypothetical protein